MSGISKEDKYTMGMGMVMGMGMGMGIEASKIERVGMDEEERGIREPESKKDAARMTEGDGIHVSHTS